MKNPKAVLAIGTAAALCGCASTPPYRAIDAEHVALVSAQYAPAEDFNAYAQGRAANALAGIGRGAHMGAVVGSVPTIVLCSVHPIGAVAGMAIFVSLVTAGAVAGGSVGLIHGATTGISSDQVEAMHGPVERTRRVGMQSVMAQRVLSAAEQRDLRTVRYFPESGPDSADSQPRYEEFKKAGFDAVLELAITTVGFEAQRGDVPQARFHMNATARVVPLGGKEEPWTRQWTYVGAWQPIRAWQDDHAGKLFSEELEAGLGSLSSNAGALFSASPRSWSSMGGSK